MKTTKIVACILTLATLSSLSNAEEVTLKVHHFNTTNSAAHKDMIVPWCAKLAKDSQDRIKCKVFPSMQLGGNPTQLYDQARDGVADIIWTISGYSPGRFPAMEVFDLPFMMTTAEATSRAAWQYYEKYAKAEFADVKLLAVHTHGPGAIFTTKKPIKTLGDLKGMKLRAPTRLTNKMIAMLGASPIGMPVPALPEALSKGVVDGAVLPYGVAPAFKIEQMTHYTAEMDPKFPALYTTVFIMAMNKAKYDSLPADLKKIIDTNSGLELSAWFGKVDAEEDIPAKAKFAAAKHIVQVIPAKELEQWQKVLDPMDAQWAADITSKGYDGKALVRGAKELIKAQTY